MNIIRQYFTHPNSRFTKVANINYGKFANICQNSETIDSLKFYPTKILHYEVFALPEPFFSSLLIGRSVFIDLAMTPLK